MDILSYILGKKSGGGSPGPGPSPEPVPITGVNFIDDYTGEVVYSYTKAEFLALTELPANPVHEGLTSQGWNWTLADAKVQVQAMDYLDIGQMYVPTDGKTHMKVRLFDGRLSPYCGFAINGTAVIEWGDGSNTDTVSGSSTTTAVMTQHTYAAAGDYEITINVTSGTLYIVNKNGYCALLHKNVTSSNYVAENAVYTNGILELYVGANTQVTSVKNCKRLSVFTTPNWAAARTGTFSGNEIAGCTKLKTFTIPTGITTIPSAEGCTSVTHISIPASARSLVENCFYGTAIETVSIPTGTTTINSGIVRTCANLRSIKWPSGFTSIPSYTFGGCSSLSYIDLPEGIRTIGSGCFSSCTSLKELTLPPTVTEISGQYTFSGTGLEKINISDLAKFCAIACSSYTDSSPFYNEKTRLFLNGTEVEDLVVPAGVTSISRMLFQGALIKSVTFNNELTSIGNYAFKNCKNLKSVTFGSGITTIGDSVFSHCDLSKIEFPDTVTSIGSNVCEYNYNLKKVKFPANLATLPQTGFRDTAILEITFPTGTATMGTSVFLNGYKNASLVIPDNITDIGSQEFYDCALITKATIGSGVTSIGTQAFTNCRGLGEIHFKPTTPPTVANVNAWTNLPTDCKIYVPTGTLSAYTSASKYPSSSTYTYIEE